MKISKEPQIELLNTGNELLLGGVRDVYLQWFGKHLFPLGLRIARQTTVPDGAVIRTALLESFSRADVLIITGGLGPTTDDITRELVSEILSLPLQLHQETLQRIQDRCHRRGIILQPRMERQAMAPLGATVLPNDQGTAPGLYIPPVEGVSWASPHLFLLPGPPRELQPMAISHVLPKLAQLFPRADKNECRIYKVVGMGESNLEADIGLSISQRGDLEVGYCARQNEVDFRLIGRSELLDEVEPSIRSFLGDRLLSTTDESLEEVVISLLRKANATLATAESCTGGALANRLTDVPGASTVFLEGFVTYSNESKIMLLGVPAELIAQYGAVSEEVVCAMAEGALERSGATYALATTGIAGPDGGSSEKPVGTVWLALAERGKTTHSWRESFLTDRATFKQRTTQTALDQLRRRLFSSLS